MIPNPITVPMTVTEQAPIPLGVSNSLEQFAIGLATAITVTGGEAYAGPYEVTPTQETQVLETAGLKMQGDVTINPIPSCYGLVTWNGSVLTVS